MSLNLILHNILKRVWDIFYINAKGTRRQSSSVAYLHPIYKLPKNLTIQTHTRAYKILLDSTNSRAIAVETNKGTYQAKNEIIICCGAYDTPKLLLLSGIGPEWHLREKGIQCLKNLPGVGENLQDHPEGVIIWETTKEVPTITTNFYEIGLFAKTNPEFSYPDLMFHYGICIFDMNTIPNGYPTAKQGLSLTPNVMQARSRGVVRLFSKNPSDPPLIDMRYFTDPEGYDEEVMINGIKLARKLMSQPSMKRWIKRELAPGISIQSDSELSEYVRKTSNTVYHPSSTCKMGNPNDPLTVVDPELRVIGIKNLRIADASIFPQLTSINPCITVMMVGEKCADMIIADIFKISKL